MIDLYQIQETEVIERIRFNCWTEINDEVIWYLWRRCKSVLIVEQKGVKVFKTAIEDLFSYSQLFLADSPFIIIVENCKLIFNFC
jgi:hypothetical protein